MPVVVTLERKVDSLETLLFSVVRENATLKRRLDEHLARYGSDMLDIRHEFFEDHSNICKLQLAFEELSGTLQSKIDVLTKKHESLSLRQGSLDAALANLVISHCKIKMTEDKLTDVLLKMSVIEARLDLLHDLHMKAAS